MNIFPSRRRVIAWLIIACVASCGLLILRGYVREYNAVSDFLLVVKDSINRDLAAHGVSDLRKVRTLIVERGHETPLIWAKVDLLSEDAEYEGRIVCCFPKGHFRRFVRSRWGLAIVQRDRDSDKGTKNRVVPYKFTGSPDLITEKKRGEQEPISKP